jgi:hypothetical protein
MKKLITSTLITMTSLSMLTTTALAGSASVGITPFTQADQQVNGQNIYYKDIDVTLTNQDKQTIWNSDKSSGEKLKPFTSKTRVRYTGGRIYS